MAHSEKKVPKPLVGLRVKRMRLAKGLTQLELAQELQKLGWDRPNKLAIYKIENGLRKLDAHEFAILAKALGCHIADFFAP